jgi:hypothetical protein
MSWMDKWQRSPRQDRRVVVDGKFVELVPLPDVTEREQSALEVVEEQVNAPVLEQGVHIDRPKQGVHTKKPDSRLVAMGAGFAPEDAPTVENDALFFDRELIDSLKATNAQISYPTGSLGEHVPDESVSEQLQAQLEPLPDVVGADGNYSAFDLDGPEHKQAAEDFKDRLADTMLKAMGMPGLKGEQNGTDTGTSTGQDVLSDKVDGPNEGGGQIVGSTVRGTVGREVAVAPAVPDAPISAADDLAVYTGLDKRRVEFLPAPETENRGKWRIKDD